MHKLKSKFKLALFVTLLWGVIGLFQFADAMETNKAPVELLQVQLEQELESSKPDYQKVALISQSIASLRTAKLCDNIGELYSPFAKLVKEFEPQINAGAPLIKTALSEQILKENPNNVGKAMARFVQARTEKDASLHLMEVMHHTILQELSNIEDNLEDSDRELAQMDR